MIDLLLMIVGELLVGFILGSFLQFIFLGLQLAGQVVGTQFGLALANVVNPQLDDQVSTVGLTYLTVASLIFLSTGAHREMFAALLETFAVLPLGGIYAHDSLRILTLALFRESMYFTVRIAAPVTVAMLLAEIAMGFVGRTVPQLNIISIGFSLRIIVGLGITMLSLHGASVVFEDEVAETFLYGYEALVNLAPE